MGNVVSAVKRSRRYLIYALDIPVGTIYLPFEIKLPATIKKVTGIAFTNTADNSSGAVTKLGTLGFISNDEADLFYSMDVYDDVYAPTDEALAGLAALSPESNQPWVTGKKPGFTKVEIDGTTGTIAGWFKTAGAATAYTIKLYVQYEELDELITVREVAT